MKTFRIVQILPLILWLTASHLVFGQGVNPQNLFDCGINMGYLTSHQAKGVEQTEAPIWAGNASAEWLDSWVPGAVNLITPDLENPDEAHQMMVATMKDMPGCTNPYFNLRSSFYQLGFNLGQAIVETGYECSSCLRLAMQKAAIEMQTIGQLLTSVQWQNLSAEVNTNAAGLNTGLSGELAAQQNAGRFGYLKSVLEQVNQLLQNDLILCNRQQKEPDNPVAEKVKTEAEKNSQFHLTLGLTRASLRGTFGSISFPGSGFYIGFDAMHGKKAFLMYGVNFFRNTAGQEYFTPSQGQVANPGEFMQAFRLNGGIGVHILQKERYSLSPFFGFALLLARSIDGNLLSIGNAVLADNTAHGRIGAYLKLGHFSAHASYCGGITPMVIVGGEDMSYRMFNLGIGVSF